MKPPPQARCHESPVRCARTSWCPHAKLASSTSASQAGMQDSVAYLGVSASPTAKYMKCPRGQDGSKRIATQYSSPKGPAVAALERPICLLGAWGLPGSTGSARDSCRGLLLTRNAHVQLARTGRCPSDQPNRLNWIVIDGVHLGGDFLPLVRHGRHITALQPTSPISPKRGGQRLSTEI